MGHGDAESVALADTLADADALWVSVGVPVALAEADGSVALADALAEPEAPDEGVPDPVHAAGEEVDAIPEVAGMTNRAPIATVPVATAPATEAADRPLRVCLGTVLAPN